MDQFTGHSPVTSLQAYIDHEIASMEANLNLHRQGLQMGGAVFPKSGVVWTANQARTIESDLEKRFAGVDKAHRWGAFSHEIGIAEVGVKPNDAQFLEGINLDLEACARAFNWPLDLIGGKRTYENFHGAMLAAYVFSIIPQGILISSELTEQLIPRVSEEVDLIFFDSSDVAVLQESEKISWSIAREKIALGAITINEWRSSQGLDPVDWGDVPKWMVKNSTKEGSDYDPDKNIEKKTMDPNKETKPIQDLVKDLEDMPATE